MSPYFFGNGCWILAKKAGNVLKGFSLVQFVFRYRYGLQGKGASGFPGIYLLMDILLSTAVRKKDNLTIFYMKE